MNPSKKTQTTALKLEWRTYEEHPAIAYVGRFRIKLRADPIYARPSIVISMTNDIRLKSIGYGDDTKAEAEGILREVFTGALEALNGSNTSSGDGK